MTASTDVVPSFVLSGCGESLYSAVCVDVLCGAVRCDASSRHCLEALGEDCDGWTACTSSLA